MKHLIAAAACAAIAGCAGYVGDVQNALQALDKGDKTAALLHFTKELGADAPDAYPDKIDDEATLLLMERGMVHQALGHWPPSISDFRMADKHMEIFAINRSPVGAISEWIFSGNSGTYRTPTHEKLMLHTLSMTAYLVQRNLEEARVEARRYQLASDDYKNTQEPVSEVGAAAYLAGFAFERSGKWEQAIQHYLDAARLGDYPSLRTVLPQVAACTSYRPEALQPFLDAAPDAQCIKNTEEGTILVITSVGRSPHKEPVRLPIGLALSIAADALSPDDAARANELAVKGLLTWVNFSELKNAPVHYNQVAVAVDGKGAPGEFAEDVARLTIVDFDAAKPKMLAAAIVRTIVRVVTGEGTAAAVGRGTGSAGLGLLAQVAVQGSMTAADTPDTRSWTTLPAALYFTRLTVPPGDHAITVTFSGPGGTEKQTQSVTVPKGGFAVVAAHALR